jgi:hypothetical protein
MSLTDAAAPVLSMESGAESVSGYNNTHHVSRTTTGNVAMLSTKESNVSFKELQNYATRKRSNSHAGRRSRTSLKWTTSITITMTTILTIQTKNYQTHFFWILKHQESLM